MTDPVEVRNEKVDTAAGAPPTAAGYPPAAYSGERVVTSRTMAVPAGFRARNLVWVSIAIVDLFLALDFIFYAAGANNVGFGSIVYTVGSALAVPFRGIFNITTAPQGHPLQWADILAIAIYTLAAWLVTRLILVATTPSNRRGVPATY